MAIASKTISCICIANKEDSWPLLQRSLISFDAQNIPDAQVELILVIEPKLMPQLELFLDRNPRLRSYCQSETIRVRKFDRKDLDLVQAIQFALQLAKGNYICFWSNDGVSHPNRLHKQYDLAVHYSKPIVLGRFLSTANGEKELRAISLEATGGEVFSQCLAETLLIDRKILPRISSWMRSSIYTSVVRLLDSVYVEHEFCLYCNVAHSENKLSMETHTKSISHVNRLERGITTDSDQANYIDAMKAMSWDFSEANLRWRGLVENKLLETEMTVSDLKLYDQRLDTISTAPAIIYVEERV